jgi:uncharacterized lipoprotein YddW (UPF0748 family)
VILLVGLLTACATSSGPGGEVRGPGTTPAPTAPTVVDTGAPGETGGTDTSPPVQTVEVGHTRELRGAWIATVYNINFPSGTGLSADAARAELDALVQTAADAGLNALFFQVRPEGDALYASELEPWSRYLTGTQGSDPGYDPLAELLERAHAHNVEVHAWLNPYRAKASSSTTAVAPHMSVVWPEHAHVYGAALWMDPASTEVRQRAVDVTVDLATRYAIDGVHFDDYFYPYPDGTPFPDDATWAAYQGGGGTLSREDWRRDNVNALIRDVHDALTGAAPHVRFGIAPFGIYRPGQPPGITGLDQYAELYADPVKWMEEGWVDYLAPQLYWPTTQSGQEYEPLLAWWCDLTWGDRPIFAGNYLSQLGTSTSWTVDELALQASISRSYAASGSLGNIWYNIDPLMDDLDGVASTFAAELYSAPALTPVLPAFTGATFAPPAVSLDGTTADVSHPSAEEVRAWTVYAADGAGWRLDRIVPARVAQIALLPGEWAVAAVSRAGVESGGVPLSVD